MDTRHEQPLFMDVAIDNEVQELPIDSGVVEKSGTLGRSSVGGYPFRVALQVAEQAAQLLPHLLNAIGEVDVIRESGQSGFLFRLEIAEYRLLHAVAPRRGAVTHRGSDSAPPG